MKVFFFYLFSAFIFTSCSSFLPDEVKVGDVKFDMVVSSTATFEGYSLADVYVTDFVRELGRFPDDTDVDPYDLLSCKDYDALLVDSDDVSFDEVGDIVITDNGTISVADVVEDTVIGDFFVPSFPLRSSRLPTLNLGFRLHAFLDINGYGGGIDDHLTVKWYVEDVDFDLGVNGNPDLETVTPLDFVEIYIEDVTPFMGCDNKLYVHSALPGKVLRDSFKVDHQKFKVVFYFNDSYVGGSDFFVNHYSF